MSAKSWGRGGEVGTDQEPILQVSEQRLGEGTYLPQVPCRGREGWSEWVALGVPGPALVMQCFGGRLLQEGDDPTMSSTVFLLHPWL